MLAQILQEMWVDPEILQALSEEQKNTLFLKMREEQVRRWKEREEKEEREGRTREHTKSKKGHSKSVRWLLGDRDNHEPSAQPSIRMQLSNDSDCSKESEEDSGSAEEDPRVPAENSSDSESGYSTDILKDWGLHNSHHRHSNHTNLPQSQTQLSITERVNPQGIGAVERHMEAIPGFGGRVAQLRRAFATSTSVYNTPVSTTSSHLQLVSKPSGR
ncbi:hypothetical protein DPEC_G00020120 [Dallia pectoralis]|uniref:Uncharacterized protein n=1 Tax=Dallia pectoralis TaxID=75939 RepID=A0ACC2HGH1_DALPE|nr:hypothetical protein DPEC_G00020120 [Dallia pectoralis]